MITGCAWRGGAGEGLGEGGQQDPALGGLRLRLCDRGSGFNHMWLQPPLCGDPGWVSRRGQQNHPQNELLTRAFHFAVDGGFSHGPSLGPRNREPCGSEVVSPAIRALSSCCPKL